MYVIFQNITFRSIIIVIFALSVFERTGISIVTHVISHLQYKILDISLSDAENTARDSEVNKEGSLKESWISSEIYYVTPPRLNNDSIGYAIYNSKRQDTFYPPVPTPPPNFL